MASKLQNESLDRGLTILQTIAAAGDCSLADLHRATGISKSAIRRLLATLIQHRLVRRSLADSRYRSTMTFPVSAGAPVPAELFWVVDVAMPYVTELTRSIDWPSDLHLIAGDRMRVLDSTRPLSPFHLYRGLVNREVNIFGSASGMCCLAELGDAEAMRIAAHTEGDPVWGLERFNVTNEEYRIHLRRTRARGYGARIARFVGETVFDDGLAAIACPIYAGPRLMGAVSLLWAKSYLDPESFAARFLPNLKQTTTQITEALTRKDTTSVVPLPHSRRA